MAQAEAKPEETVDGQKLKELVNDEGKFDSYVKQRFAELDKSHTGTLSKQELEKELDELGGILGLPPRGSSKESDHIYDEVFSEFGSDAAVNESKFGQVLRDIFLGVADGLERDPIHLIKLDGLVLREYAESGRFSADSFSVYSRLDSKNQGSISGKLVPKALQSINVRKGMPPACDPHMQPLVAKAMQSAGVNEGSTLTQATFADCLKPVVLALADALEKEPVMVAYSEKTYDGSSIRNFMKDSATLHTYLDASWNTMPLSKGCAPRKYIRDALEQLSGVTGLPPVGAVEEVDDLINTVFHSINLDDENATVSKEKFEKEFKVVLGSLMLQLEGKPVTVKQSEIVK